MPGLPRVCLGVHSGPGAGDGGCAWAQQHAFPLPKDVTATSRADGLAFQQQRPITSPDKRHHSLGEPASHLATA